MDKIFPNMRKEMVIQIQEAQRTPNCLDEPKEAHTKTHFKSSAKSPKQRQNLENSKRKQLKALL